MSFKLTINPVPADISPLGGSLATVALSKSELVGAFDSLIEMQDRKIEELTQFTADYPFHNEEGKPVPAWASSSHKSQYVNFCLSPSQQRRLKIPQNIISRAELTKIFHDRNSYSLPKSIREAFDLLKTWCAYGGDRGYFESVLASARDDRNCDVSAWDKIEQQSNAFDQTRRRTVEREALIALRQTIVANDSDTLYVAADTAQYLEFFINHRLQTGGEVALAGWNKKIIESHHYSFTQERQSKVSGDIYDQAVLWDAFAEAFDEVAGKEQRKKLVAEFGDTEVAKRFTDIGDMMRDIGLNVHPPQKPSGKTL